MWQLGLQPEPHRRATPDLGQSPKVRAQASQVVACRPTSADACGGAVPRRVLPSSVSRGFSSPAAQIDFASQAYLWTPCHVRKNEPSITPSTPAVLQAYGTGAYISTLAMDLRKETFVGAVPHLIRLDYDRFAPDGERPWCYMLSGSCTCFVVKGCVMCTELPPESARTDSLVVGRLPEDMRPLNTLRFAARACETGADLRVSSTLITLVCQPDGCIMVEAGRDHAIWPGSVIDLSAIRFCKGGGVSLIDDVMLHLCDVNGTRIVCLQGTMNERSFEIAGRTALSLLPSCARIPKETFFITPGLRGSCFHLLLARPRGEGRIGGTGDLIWSDSRWHRDTICVNGVMWEADAEALLIENPLEATQVTESQVVLIMDFQKYIVRRFGSVQDAWDRAFDVDGSGALNFTEFGEGCKVAGFVGNATKLWAALDIDHSGHITVDELAVDAAAMLDEARARTVKQRAEASKRLQDEAELAAAHDRASKPVVEGRWANSNAAARWNGSLPPSARTTAKAFLEDSWNKRNGRPTTRPPVPPPPRKPPMLHCTRPIRLTKPTARRPVGHVEHPPDVATRPASARPRGRAFVLEDHHLQPAALAATMP